MKRKGILAALLLAFAWAFAAQAGTTTFQGVTIDYENASANLVNGELVLQYKTAGTSSLTISDGAVKADILVVGGGGGGGRSNSTSSYYGSGNGGSVLAIANQVLPDGSYEIAVGSGGSGAASNGMSGFAGGESSLKGGSVSKTAAGGGGGGTSAAAGSPTTGTESLITGASVFYGKGGVKASGSTTAGKAGTNPGDGGTGNKRGASGGSGAKGIVVVRLKEAYAVLEDLDLPIGGTVSEFRDALDNPVSFAYSDVTCSSSIDLVASVVETADGKVGVVGHLAGQTQITIVAGSRTYLLVVTVNPLITGLYQAGAYEVAVTNASEVKYVDGDLVITYLDTSAAEKSFTLPQPTTARLLAVGGGGAGGQDEKRSGTKSKMTGGYDANYGLPGGGGAGGFVFNNAQEFEPATYAVTVGAGGAEPGREFVNVYVSDYDKNMDVWRPTSFGTGADGGDSSVGKVGEPALATAKGGGGGGRRGLGNGGGSGGGGSYSGGSKNGGSGASGQGNAGGNGGHAKFGAGGGGAGGPGVATAAAEASADTTTENVDGSGAGGPGKTCDITGEMLEYARGGAGGVPRVYPYYYYKNGVLNYTKTTPTDQQKRGFDNGKYFWVEASDGKPGRDGFGDGGGGSGHYGTNPTFAGRGGNGAVIVRIPPYKTKVEDALKAAFADRPVTVSGSTVTLTGDVTGPIDIPDNLGAVTIKLNGHAIIGADGADGDDIMPGDDGQPALKIVPHEYDCESGVTILSMMGSGSLKGGNGGKGYPGGAGAQAVAADGFAVNVADGIGVTTGATGESFVQHPHKWAYTIRDNKIVAYCVADDGEPCSYRDQSRGPFVAVSAADAAYTAMRYEELTAVNGITPVTGIVVAPETYVGRDGTDYPESSTPPREQGAYTVNMQLGDLRITSDFTITEPKPSQGSVYQAWKTAERRGRDVQICLSATFDGSKAINDGNVLFLGSRCSAHSMAGGTVESSVNAMTRYASVRWYAYGSSDPANNLVNRLTKKGEKVAAGTVTLVGANHFVHKEIMDDLYAELVEKRNLADGYDLIILEFDGDLLCREGYAPYQLNYRLPEGWTDEKAARLRAAMSRYYAEDRVVWIVPDVNQPKSDAGYTGEYPWTSNPEFIWQRAFLNATETEGYRCPLQKNYEDTDELVDYLQEVLVGHFFSNAIIKDKLAEGLTIRKVTPQMRSDGGIWRNFEGGPSRYTIPEPRSGTTVTADVERVERQVTVTFDMKAEQAWACEHDQVIGDNFRVVIDASLDGFFSGTTGEWQETNEGPATFTFTESNLDDDEEGFTITIEKDSPKIQNVKLTPDYTSEDVVRIYDGKGTNIVVKPIAPEPENAIIRYSLDEHGTYVDDFALTNVCDKTKVWFTITDKSGEFNTVTNFATVTILPRVVVEQAEDASKPSDGTPLTQPAHSNVLSQAIVEAEKMYPGRGASAAGFITGEGFASVPMTSDSQQTEVGSHANTIDRDAVTVNEKTDKNNYVFIYLPGILTVTPGTFEASASPALKVYDGEPTNIAVTVTGVPEGVTPVLAYSYSETEGFVPASDFTGPTNVSESATVYCKVTVPGCGEKVVHADVTILRRYVVEQAGSASKPFDNTPLVCGDHDERPAEELKDALAAYKDLYGEELAASAAGFITGEGFASVPMTSDSTITNPGVVSNTIDSAAVTFTPSYDPDNYLVRYLQGELKVTPATFTASAESVEKFYDSTPTNIAVTVTGVPDGVTPTYEYSYSGTEGFVPAADFTGPTNVLETATVYCRVIIPGTTNVVSATATIKPRIVVSHAKDGEWTFNGQEHAQPDSFEDEDAEAEKSKEKWGTDEVLPGSTGFVDGEGYAADLVMTDASRITLPGTKPNVIDQTADKVALAANTRAGNYELYYLDGELKVTPATFTASAESVEKFYDADPTNITWAVTNAQGVAITDAVISLREKGTDEWIPAADFVPYVDTTNATVEVKAEKDGFTPVTAEATVVVKPRPVTLVAGSSSKTYDGLPLTNWTFTVKADTTTEGYGFVTGEGVASVTMTPESTVTLPGSQPNVIASENAKENTKLERNYTVTTEPGTLTVTAAVMGIEAFPVEKFYDAEPTNITWAVTNAMGAAITDATITLREKGTDPWIPAADFALYVDTTNVTVEVKAEKNGFDPVTAEATVLVKPRPVTLVAGSSSKTYDGLPLTNWTFTVKEDAAPEYGFVKEEGVASVTMTGDSTITNPGSVDNVIASETAKPNTKLDRNYVVSIEKGTLTVTAATFTASATPYDEFYDGQEHTIEVDIQKPEEAGEVTITYAYAEGGAYLPIEDFEQLKDVTSGGPVTVYAKIEVEGYSTVVVNATVNIKPRIVVEQAESAEKIFDGLPLVQPNHHEEADVEAEKSKAKWGTDEVLANSTGFVAGEGFAAVPMTAGSTITEPGVEDNVIDAAAVTLLEGTKPGNYILFYLPGELAIIQRQEEVRRDPEVEIPEESKKVVEESDKKIEKALDEMAKSDQEATGEPYVKYQLTVTPTNNLSEVTRTTPEKAAEDAKEQIELFRETVPDAKVDKVEFVDIVLERTYDKTEAEETAKGNYNKDNWESIDKAEEHGNKLLEVTIPIEVPEGMELIGVTRSCDNKGTEILKPKDPKDSTAEGFVYDPETKTVTLYAYDFCVFGFMMKEKTPPPPPPVNPCGRKDPVNEGANVYQLQMQLRSTWGIPCSSDATAELCGRSNPGVSSVIRIPASFVVNAWLYNCTNACWTLENSSIVAWEQNRAKFFSQPAITWDLLNIIGVSTDQSETAFTFTGRIVDYSNGASATPLGADWSVTCAGQGTFSRSAGKYIFFSGYCAGDVSASYCIQGKICEASKVATCGSSLTTCPTGVAPSAVYGRWALRYNEQASLQYWRDGTFSIPANIRR